MDAHMSTYPHADSTCLLGEMCYCTSATKCDLAELT